VGIEPGKMTAFRLAATGNRTFRDAATVSLNAFYWAKALIIGGSRTPTSNKAIRGRMRLTGFRFFPLIAVAAWFTAEKEKNSSIAVTMVASAYIPQRIRKTRRAVTAVARLFNPD
jgi:hypothetical protein